MDEIKLIPTEVGKRSIGVKIGNFLSRVNLKLDGWPWKTIEHLVYTLSSFVHHFKTMVGWGWGWGLGVGGNNTQFGLVRWNAHRLCHLCLWMWTSPLQYWKQLIVYVLTPWLLPWSYTLLLTFNTVDTVVFVKFAFCTCSCYYFCICEICLWTCILNNIPDHFLV